MTRLEWDGCVNVRDLGGLPTEDGAVLRDGLLIRSGALGELSPRGWEAVRAVGIAHVVDLRELDAAPSAPPAGLEIEITRVDLYPDNVLPSGQFVEEDLEAAEDLAEFFGLRYVRTLERRGPQLAEAIRAAATAEGPLVVHCLAGKDRTGVVIGLILRVLGVPVEEIVADYALSETEGRVALERWVEAAPDEEMAADRRKRIGAPAGAMRQLLREVDRRYGGARPYLIGIGVPEDDLNLLTGRLKTRPSS